METNGSFCTNEPVLVIDLQVSDTTKLPEVSAKQTDVLFCNDDQRLFFQAFPVQCPEKEKKERKHRNKRI